MKKAALLALLLLLGVGLGLLLRDGMVGWEQAHPSEAAVEQAFRALQSTPRDAHSWAALGDAQAASDDPIGAQHSYETAIRLGPADPNLLGRLGFLLYARGDDRRAWALLEQAKAGGADLPMLDFTLAQLATHAPDAGVPIAKPPSPPADEGRSAAPREPEPHQLAASVTDAGQAPADARLSGERVCELPLADGQGRRVRYLSARAVGQELRMVFDTGASITALTQEAAARLGLTPDAEHAVRVFTAAGPAQFPTAALPELWIGARDTGPLEIVVCPSCGGPGSDGLLGLDVQARLGLSLDLVNSSVRFRDCE